MRATVCSSPSPGPTGQRDGVLWSAVVALLVVLAIAGPLVWGLPLVSSNSSQPQEANFALQLVHGYAESIRSGHWFPRWLAEANGGLGAPVFYFQGRLPFLLAGWLTLLLHGSAAIGLIVSLGAFRLLAFLTCRSWLRMHVSAPAANCGALAFLALPFAMLYNPIGRVAYAETAATAFLPLIFLVLDRGEDDWKSAGREIAFLALIYAALAATHLPQTLLGCLVASLYALLLSGMRGLVVNVAAAGVGLLISAPSVFPALSMQDLINTAAWHNDPYSDIRNNFLFTLSRFHLFHILAQEIYLHSTWLLCLCILLLFLTASKLWSAWRIRRDRAVLVCLLLCLLGMTKLAWPMWVNIPELSALQFPWRLLPVTLALAGAAVSLIVATSREWRKVCIEALAWLILAQVAVPAIGKLVSNPQRRLAALSPAFITSRVPIYAPWSHRDDPANTAPGSIVAAYIPARARQAGWHPGPQQSSLLLGSRGTPPSYAVPPTLSESQRPDGAFVLKGQLAAPASFPLPSFYFPDEELSGNTFASSMVADPATGLTRIALPAGTVALVVDHEARTQTVVLADMLSILGIVLSLILLIVSLHGRRRRSYASAR